jgi:hypothetical protein
VGGTMTTYHIEVVYETVEYFRVEADSETDAKEQVLDSKVDLYNWDQDFQEIKVEKVLA